MQPSPDAAGFTGHDESVGTRLFELDRLELGNVDVYTAPFPFLVAREQLPPELCDRLYDEFPRFSGAGYLPHEPAQCTELINALIAYMTSAEFSNAVGQKLGLENLAQYPTLVSMSRTLNRRHGTIHTDGKAKVATVLMYLNPDWTDSSDGCLRFLNRIDDIEDVVIPEIPPVYGTLVGFQRCDNSFHGHLPFEGERHVVQVAWIVSEAEKQRKMKRGGFSGLMKRLLGALDKRLGSKRDKSASHR